MWINEDQTLKLQILDEVTATRGLPAFMVEKIGGFCERRQKLL